MQNLASVSDQQEKYIASTVRVANLRNVYRIELYITKLVSGFLYSNSDSDADCDTYVAYNLNLCYQDPESSKVRYNFIPPLVYHLPVKMVNFKRRNFLQVD